jgi:DNA-binding transcriptional ArsR family regulator
MFTTASLAETAALVGDPARAAMLMTLMDGRALTASELARVAGVTPQTASGHLARLTAAGLLGLHCQGRHHYHRLASPAVARMLESIIEVTAANEAERPRKPVVTGPRDRAMRAARTCYDHLAGQLGVSLADALTERGYVELSSEGGAVTEAGIDFCRDFGVDLGADRGGHVYCRPCLDWSERRLHIGGAVGAALAARCFALNWIRRSPDSRAVSVTPAGERGFRERFGM